MDLFDDVPSTYIYFAFTRPQVEYVIRHRHAHQDARAHLIYSGAQDGYDGSFDSEFSEVFSIESGTGRLNRNNHVAFREAVKYINRWIDAPIYLIFPGILHPLANALFATFRKNRNIIILIYAEGISSYLDISLPMSWRLRFHILRWLGVLKGFHRGIALKGHSHGLDMPSVMGLIAEYPDLLVRHGKPIERLSVDKQDEVNISDFANEVVFVGQPHLDRRTNLIALYSSLAEGLSDFFNLELKYKPHHFEPVKQIEAAKKAGFTIVDSTAPFEEWLRTCSPAAVVSFRSTALINAGRILGRSGCVYTFAPFLVKPPDEYGGAKDLYAIMRRFGVQTFPSDSNLGKLEYHLASKLN